MALSLDSVESQSLSEGRGSDLHVKRDASRSRHLSHSDLLEITEMLCLLVTSNVPMGEILQGLVENTSERQPKRRKLLQAIFDDVQGGRPLSEAMAAFPRDFSPIYIQMIHAGEISGGLTDTLKRLHNFLDQDRKIRGAFSGGVILPAIMMAFTCCAVTFLLLYVVPKLEGIFKGKEQFLPAISRFMFFISRILRFQWMWVLLGLASLVVMVYFLWKNPVVNRHARVAFMHIPLFGLMYKEMMVSRVTNVLGALLSRNVPVLDSLGICEQLSNNIVYQRLWQETIERVKSGEPLSVCVSGTGILPEFFAQIVRVGEKGGNLGEVLSRFAVGLNERTLRKIENTSKMIEPLMIIIMGGVVGFVVFSFMLPILKIKDTMMK